MFAPEKSELEASGNSEPTPWKARKLGRLIQALQIREHSECIGEQYISVGSQFNTQEIAEILYQMIIICFHYRTCDHE